MRLYAYYRSSTSYRLRIELNLKGLDYAIVPVDLLAGEQREPAYRARNPFAGVPALEVDGQVMAQSMAILEWLEERYPQPPLLPGTMAERFCVRELAMAIATELHAPLNQPVLAYLERDLGHSREEVRAWYHHWLAKTLRGLEARLAMRAAGRGEDAFLFGAPGLFETVLVPQLYNARRFGFALDAYPQITGVEAACLGHPAFVKAHPDNQPDSPPTSR